MKRRDFVTLLVGAAVGWPFVASAQQAGKVYRIGILETRPAAQNADNFNALRKGLRDLGYVEGQNLVIEYRSSEGRAERFPDLASELVSLKVDLIVTRGSPAAKAAKNATGTIPVVMAAMGAPLVVVASFARPGGNITGLTTFTDVLTGKRACRELRCFIIWAIRSDHLNGKRRRRRRAPWVSRPSFLTYEARKTCVTQSK